VNNLVSRMKADLIWYVPLSVAVAILLVVPNLVNGYDTAAFVLRQFSWTVLTSPATYLFLACVFASAYLPLRLMLMIPPQFHPGSKRYGERYIVSFVIVIGVAVTCSILQSIMWGSCPLAVDQGGSVHIRLLPFLPWPDSEPTGWV